MSFAGGSDTIGAASVDLVLNADVFDQQLAEVAAQADAASSSISDGLQVEPGLDTATYDAALGSVQADTEAVASAASDALQVEASVDTSQFDEGLSELQDSAESTAEAADGMGGVFSNVGTTISNAMGEAGSAVAGLVEAGIDRLEPQIAKVGAAAGPVGTAIAAAAATATAAIGASVHATQDWAAGIRQLQTVTGLSAEEASSLAGAGSELGLTIDQLTSGFGLLSKAIVNGSTGLDQYGISTRDAEGNILPFSDVLSNVSDKFLSLPEGPERAAFAMNVFGRSGRQLIPILSQGSAGLAELEQKARDAGLVMSQDDVDASKELTSAQRELGTAFKGAAVQLGELFIPAVTALVRGFRDALAFIVRFGRGVGQVFNAIGRAAKPALDFISNALKDVSAAWGDFASAFGDLFREIGDALGPLIPYFERFVGLLAVAGLAVFVQALEALAQGLEIAARYTALFVDWIGPKLQSAVDAAVNGINVFVSALNVVIDGINRVIDVSNALIGTHFDHVAALEAVIGPTIDLTHATEEEAQANRDATTAIESHTAAMRQHRLAQLEAAGGVLGLVSALRSAGDAQRTVNRLQADGKTHTAEYRQAVFDAVQATLDFRTQVRQFAAEHPALSFDQMRDRLKEMAHQAGISGQDLRDAIGHALDDIEGKIRHLNSQRLTVQVDDSQLDALRQKMQSLLTSGLRT